MNGEINVKIRKVSIAGRYGKMQLPTEWLKLMNYPAYVRITLSGKTLLVDAEAV